MKIRITGKGLPKAQYQNSQITPKNAPKSIGNNLFPIGYNTSQVFPATAYNNSLFSWTNPNLTTGNNPSVPLPENKLYSP